MPTPLLAKRPPALTMVEQFIWVMVIGGPALGLWYCWDHHQQIHLEDPRLNLAVHITLFIIPLLWTGLMFYQPVVYESRDGETLLATLTFFNRLLLNWWMMFLLWATPVVAAVALGHGFFSRYLPHPENLSTSPGKALAVLIVMTCLSIFYAAILLARSEPATWISDAGLRTGILRFHRWQDLHHVSKRGKIFTFYHRVNPALPLAAFEVRNHEAQAILEKYLAEHQVAISDAASSSFSLVKIALILGFVLNIVISLWLRFNAGWSFLPVVLISFGLGIVMTLVLEQYRGIAKFGKYMPAIEPAKED